MLQKAAVLVVLTLTVAACGSTTQERGAAGGAAGAAAGAIAGELITDDAALGALVGGAIGAGAGALTNCQQFGTCRGPLSSGGYRY